MEIIEAESADKYYTEGVGQAKAIYMKILTKSEELKKSILEKASKGEL